MSVAMDDGRVSEAEVEAALDVWFSRPDWREVYANGPPIRDYMRRSLEAAAAARPSPAGDAEAEVARLRAALAASEDERSKMADVAVDGWLKHNRLRWDAEERATTAESALTEARAENARLRLGKDRFKSGVRAAVTWLHARAKGMTDPQARAILDSAATNLGWDLAAERVQDAAVHPEAGP